jgi:hypothetical protein
MIRLVLIFSFLVLSFLMKAQILMDSVAYKAFLLTAYIDGEQMTGNTDVLFYIDNGRVQASVENQIKRLTFLTEPQFEDIGTDQPNLMSQCIDNGRYKCSFFVVYEEKTDTYGLIVNYSNGMLFFQCKLSDERPWDNDPTYYIDDNLYRTDPQYTDEEVETFFDQFGNGKLIKEAIVKDFYMEIMTNQ